MVVELEAFRPHRFEVSDLNAGLEFEFFSRRDFVTRRDPDHVAVLAHVQTPGLENNVQAWSQGTSFNRSVSVPPTVSLVMILKLVKSAMT